MSQYDCMLMLALPAALEEEALDFLSSHPEWVNSFFLVRGEGFGSGATLRSTMEQVRGRAQRVLVMLLMEAPHREALLAGLREQFPSDEVAWWTLPVNAFGRLA